MLRLLNATIALLVSGIYGTLTGFIVGTIIGFVVGCVAGLPVGFAAAVLGAAIGSRRGWMLSGGLMGLIGGILIYNGMVGHWPRTLGETAWMLYLTLAPSLAGFFVGGLAERGLNADVSLVPPKPRALDVLQPLRRVLGWSRLYDQPLWNRVLLALALLALELIVTRWLLTPRLPSHLG